MYIFTVDSFTTATRHRLEPKLAYRRGKSFEQDGPQASGEWYLILYTLELKMQLYIISWFLMMALNFQQNNHSIDLSIDAHHKIQYHLIITFFFFRLYTLPWRTPQSLRWQWVIFNSILTRIKDAIVDNLMIPCRVCWCTVIHLQRP